MGMDRNEARSCPLPPFLPQPVGEAGQALVFDCLAGTRPTQANPRNRPGGGVPLLPGRLISDEEPVGHPLKPEVPGDALTPGPPYGLAPLRVAQQPGQDVRILPGFLRLFSPLDQHPAFRRHQLTLSTHISSHNRDPTGHGLIHGQGNPLPLRGQKENVGRREQVSNIRVGQGSKQADVTLQQVLLHKSPQPLKVRSVASHEEQKIGGELRQPGDRLGQDCRLFLRAYPSDKHNEPCGLGDVEPTAGAAAPVRVGLPVVGVNVDVADLDSRRVGPSLFHPALQMLRGHELSVEQILIGHRHVRIAAVLPRFFFDMTKIKKG